MGCPRRAGFSGVRARDAKAGVGCLGRREGGGAPVQLGLAGRGCVGCGSARVCEAGCPSPVLASCWFEAPLIPPTANSLWPCLWVGFHRVYPFQCQSPRAGETAQCPTLLIGLASPGTTRPPKTSSCSRPSDAPSWACLSRVFSA